MSAHAAEQLESVLNRNSGGDAMFTSRCEYIDLPKNGTRLTKTERGSLRRMHVVGSIGENSSANVRQVIWMRDRHQDGIHHADRYNREVSAGNVRDGALCALTGEYRSAINAVPSGAATTSFMYARAQVVDTPEKGDPRQ